MRKIIVTGGAGFLGSHLCDLLLQQNHHVLCVDNYFSSSRKNLQSIIDNKNFEVIRQDVCIPLYAEADEIFHLACPASPKYYQIDPIQTLKTSVLGTLNMLGLAKRTKAKLLFTSTSEIYGDPQVHPQPEEYWGNVNPIGPRACYDEGKRAAETLCRDYAKIHDVDSKIVRIFNTYGPRMATGDGRVVSNFIMQALRGEKLTIYGSGKQTRSFCYVDDLVQGLLLMMSSDFSGPFNLGNPEEYNMIELALKIKDLCNSTSELEFVSLPVDDPQQRKPNTSKAQQGLNWTPTTNLETGLKKTIEYFSSIL